MKDLEKRVSAIELRNERVEKDKDWETSWARKITIAGLTYVVVCVYLAFVIQIDPWLNALVPVCGFLLSTLALEQVREFWEGRMK